MRSFRLGIKRAIDLVGALVLLVLSSPVLLVAAVAVKVSSRGPVFFRQQRVGKDGMTFSIFKLRTMVEGAESAGAGLAINEGDSRITKAGALLRRTSIDELPNLFNVVAGEMSIVGPRPTLPHQVEKYSDRHRRRLEVRPGITGWAQVGGRAALPWSQRIELDIWYVDHWSNWLDLKILAKTVAQLLTGRGLYKGSGGGWDL